MSAAVLLSAWGLSWVLVRSAAGGIVREPFNRLSAFGEAVVALSTVSGVPTVTAAGQLARLLTIPAAALRCPGCTGFWTGIASSMTLAGTGPLESVGVGFASAGVCAVLDAVTGAAVTWTERNLRDAP